MIPAIRVLRNPSSKLNGPRKNDDIDVSPPQAEHHRPKTLMNWPVLLDDRSCGRIRSSPRVSTPSESSFLENTLK